MITVIQYNRSLLFCSYNHIGFISYILKHHYEKKARGFTQLLKTWYKNKYSWPTRVGPPFLASGTKETLKRFSEFIQNILGSFPFWDSYLIFLLQRFKYFSQLLSKLFFFSKIVWLQDTHIAPLFISSMEQGCQQGIH